MFKTFIKQLNHSLRRYVLLSYCRIADAPTTLDVYRYIQVVKALFFISENPFLDFIKLAGFLS